MARALGIFGRVIRLEANACFPQRLAKSNVDLVFNIAEGLDGPSREAHVPALCELLGVPYTGSDPLTLCVGLQKARAKEVFAARGIPTAPYAVVERLADLDAVDLPFPVFAKPLQEGSSRGISVRSYCESPSQLAGQALYLLTTYEEPVLVERYLPGNEYTVAILGTGEDAQCLPIVAMRFDALPQGVLPIYGYEAKWVWDSPDKPLRIFECPAALEPAVAATVASTALAAYRALGCRDWGRVDLRCDEAGVPHVIEVNPIPGVLPDPEDNSCFPKAARAAGMSYDELLQRVVELAWERLTDSPLPTRQREVA